MTKQPIERSATMTRQVVETLYSETLVLADEARAVFAREEGGDPSDAAYMAHSLEGMKTTTRIMHMLAWLLNQRAFFANELSAKQVMLYGALAKNRQTDLDDYAMLSADAQDVVRASETLYTRIARLDEQQRGEADTANPAHSLQNRVLDAFAA